jgi:hypothetical protein
VTARLRRVDIVGLALLSYVPFFLSSPGKVSADTKPYLYLDPGRLLARSAYLWSDHLGTGTVPHQGIGYLFPMGPYYWFMDQIGVPDWVAQRFWMGSISFAAAVGVLWLLTMLGTRRAGALVGALVYVLTPYQLAFTARISVLLLPWAALPWLVGLTARALSRKGWRDPALFALVALAAGSINATSLLLVGIAPVLWLVVSCVQRRSTIGEAAATAGRIGLLTVGVSLWWAVGLVLQGRYGFSVLDATESLARVSGSSLPADLARGFGNWFLSGSDRIGPWLVQGADYRDEKVLTAVTLLVPVAAFVAAGCLRWRHRAYFIVLIVVGVIVGVGAWPYGDPSALGSVFKRLANGSAIGLALRNTPRVVPVIVLGVAALLAAAVSALATRPRLRIAVVGIVVGCVLLGFAPVWRHGYLSDGVERPNDIPQYWQDAAAAMDAEGGATRVLEIPGSLFTAYRWGNTNEPVTPGLIDRPYVARELLPYGTAASVNLLAALDRRIQEGTLDAAALAPVARFLRAGTISLRSDLQYERYDTPRPRSLWRLLTSPPAPGLGAPAAFGGDAPNRAIATLPMFDALELEDSGSPSPPKVALFPVRDAAPIVDTKSAERPVVLAGDGDGIVDASSAGLLDGHQLVQYAVTLRDPELLAALRRNADLVLTDSARKRARRWDLLRDDVGATERAGQTSTIDDSDDQRLDEIPRTTDADRTVVEQQGARVDERGTGTVEHYAPEDRPAQALDGDPGTAWRVPASVSDAQLIIRPDEPVRTDRVTLVQATGPGDPNVTSVRLSFDHGAPVTVALDERSRTAAGQVVQFPERTIRRLVVEPLATDAGDDTGGGFAEVGLGDVRVREVVQVPTRTLRRAGAAGQARRLAIVLTRLRQLPESGRASAEATLVREFTLPYARGFALTGTARVSGAATDDQIDRVLGTTASGATFSSSGRLAGTVAARASRAFDGDPATAWTAPFGGAAGQSLDAHFDTPRTVGGAGTVTVVADGRHSVPTRLRIEADGGPVASVDLPSVADGPSEGATTTVPVSFAPVVTSDLRMVVETARPVTATDGTLAPVALAEVAVPGIEHTATPAVVPSACRADLLTVDGNAVSVRLTGTPGSATTGLGIEPCGEPLALGAGRHEIASAAGGTTGVDLDQLVLGSAAGGGPDVDPAARVGAPPPASGARVRVVDAGETSFDLRVHTDGRPFWLVLGQSLSDGWEATTASGHSLGAPRLVDGFANGWLVRPDAAGTMHIELRWTPQRWVWWGLGISVAAVLLCLALVLVTWRRRRAGAHLEDSASVVSPWRFPGTDASWPVTVALAAGVGITAALVSRPLIGLAVAVVTLVAARVAPGRLVLVAGAPLALVLAKALDVPELGWVAVLLLGADLVVGHWRPTPPRQSAGVVGPDEEVEEPRTS